MEVHILSRELIKPSLPAITCQNSYKLCLFDQLTPTTYIPIIYFYPMNNFSPSTLTHMKKSLVEVLNLYHPFSGRVNNNLCADNFDQGIPFFVAKVNCSISDFLKHPEMESLLNLFLPCQPYGKETDMNVPIIAVQITMFSCGGIAISSCLSHKICDVTTCSNFITTWASFCRGDLNEVIQPDLEQGSSFFPSRASFPQNHLSIIERLWFGKAKYITRRFVFDSKALAALKAKAKSEIRAEEPTRVETLSCFIWIRAMAASKAISGTSKISILVEAVNLRRKTNPPMKDSSTGNLFWWAVASANPTDEKSIELSELVNMLSETIALYKSDYTHSFQGEEGIETMSEYSEQLEGIFSSETPDIFAFTSWTKSPFTRPDFGWGEPFWVGLMGKPGPEFRNLTVFIDTKDGRGIEAWITLDEEKMATLQQDSEFLEFASPNPRISSL